MQNFDYLKELKVLTAEPTLVGNWGGNSCETMFLNIQQPSKLQFRAYNLDADVALPE